MSRWKKTPCKACRVNDATVSVTVLVYERGQGNRTNASKRIPFCRRCVELGLNAVASQLADLTRETLPPAKVEDPNAA